jgi:hypothetical protein
MEKARETLTPKGWSADMEHTGTGSYMGDDATYYNYKNMLPTLIPPLDILLLFTNEADAKGDTSVTYDHGVAQDLETDESPVRVQETGQRRAIVTDALIEGVEFVDYGQVTSIHDIVTEINMSWLARNVMPLTREEPRTTTTYREVGTPMSRPMPDVFTGEPDNE